MTPDDITRLVEQTVSDTIESIVDRKLDDFNKNELGFRSWQPVDSVTDQFSPITGASQQIGFFGTPKIAKPTVTGAKGGNAALTSLCSVLSSLGLITNSTS